MYSYALNYPLVNIDPSGQSCITVTHPDGSQGQADDGDGQGCAGADVSPTDNGLPPVDTSDIEAQQVNAEERSDALQFTYDFGAGVLDDLTFGFSTTVFDWTGVGANINACSTAFTAGQWTGFAASIAAGGGAGLLKLGIQNAGKAGIEFSHFIPQRVGRQIGGSIGAFIESKSALNGNWVTIARHYLQDPRRFPAKAIQAAAGPKLPPALAVLDHTPRLLVGTAAGTAYGAAGKALGTSCR